jgi:hypothetical protein
MERPVFALQVRPEPDVSDVIRSLRVWLKQGLRSHGLRCVSIEEVTVSKSRRIGIPTAASIDDVWQRRATAAAIAAVRQMFDGDAIPKATPVGRLTDVELGWLIAAGLFAWIRTRAEQATAEGWDSEQALRLTALDPEPWDAGAVTHILSQLADLDGIDWSKPVGAWSKDTITRFILTAIKLTSTAMLARDLSGGGVTTSHKSLDEMQRTASAEAGGSLVTPNKLNDDVPFDL